MLLFFLTLSLIPSTEYFESVLLPNCTLIDNRFNQLIQDFDNMRSEEIILPEVGMRLQDFRETILNTASDISSMYKC